jgi:hypothetical protein
MIWPDDQLPSDAPLLCHMLMVVLRRQCTRVLTDYFPTAAFTSENSRMIGLCPWVVNLIESNIIALL